MEKKKKVLIIAGSAGGALLIALIAVIAVLSNRPAAILGSSINNTLKDAEKIEVFKIIEDTANGGSVSLSANLDEYADDVKVDAKYYSDIKDLKGAFNMTWTEDDETFLQTDIRYNDKSVTMSAPEFFDGTYGVNLGKLEKNLPGSIFDPDEETDYSLDDDEFEFLLNLQEYVKNDKNLSKESAKIQKKYCTLAIKKILKYSEVSRSTKTITVGEDNIRCRVISITLDGEALANIGEDLINYALEDKELESYLTLAFSNIGFYTDTEDLVDDFYDELEATLEDIEEYRESEKVEIITDFYITSSSRIAKFNLTFKDEESEQELSLVLGKDISKSEEMSFFYKKVNDMKAEEISVTYEVKENTNKAFEADIKFKDEFERFYSSTGKRTENSKIKLKWNKKDGECEFKFDNDDDDSYVIKGILTEKGDKLTFVLTNIREDGEAVEKIKSLELTIIVDRNDPTPKVSSRYTEITTLNERDFKHLSGDIKDGIKDVIKDTLGW